MGGGGGLWGQVSSGRHYVKIIKINKEKREVKGLPKVVKDEQKDFLIFIEDYRLSRHK